MAKIIPKVYAHGCYIGTTGYNNHTRDFFRELSKLLKLKIRNFTVPQYFKGIKDEPFNREDYLTNLDKKLLVNQGTWNNKVLEDNLIYDIPLHAYCPEANIIFENFVNMGFVTVGKPKVEKV